MSIVLVGQDDQPADADRDRRQAGQARARVGRRRRRRQHERRSPARNPHRRRHREAERPRPVDRPGARRDPEGERRDPRRHARAGQVGSRAAHAGPRRRDRTSSTTSSSRPSTARRSRIADIGYAEDSAQRVMTSLFIGRRQPGGAARRPARLGREHHQGHRSGQAEARLGAPDAAARRHADASTPTTRGSSTRRSRRSKSTCCGAACSRRWS